MLNLVFFSKKKCIFKWPFAFFFWDIDVCTSQNSNENFNDCDTDSTTCVDIFGGPVSALGRDCTCKEYYHPGMTDTMCERNFPKLIFVFTGLLYITAKCA